MNWFALIINFSFTFALYLQRCQDCHKQTKGVLSRSCQRLQRQCLFCRDQYRGNGRTLYPSHHCSLVCYVASKSLVRVAQLFCQLSSTLLAHSFMGIAVPACVPPRECDHDSWLLHGVILPLVLWRYRTIHLQK